MSDETLESAITTKSSAVADAGAAFLAGLSAEAQSAPVADPEEEQTGLEPEAEEPESEEAPDEQPRDETGKFAKKDEQESAEESEPAEEAVPEEAPAETVVVLKGMAERGEEDLEIEVADAETAERLRRLQNDGLRRKEFDRLMAERAAEDEERDTIKAIAEANPVGFMVNMILPERRVEVAKALLAEHFEELRPEIESLYEDPMKARERRLETRERASVDQVAAEKRIQSDRTAAQILHATHALVPDGVDPALHAQFVRDAERDLIDAVRAGQPISPADVPRVLDRRLKMYGFTQSNSPAVARPVSDRARAIAAKKPSETAQAGQARIKRVQTQRKAANAIAPAGRGAAAVVTPIVPKGADIASASKAVLKSARSWADLRTS